MKKYFLFLLAAVVFISCDMRRKDKIADDVYNQMKQVLKDTTIVQVIDSVYDFGKVTDGEKVEYNYRFKNVGNKPLVIINALASCGCTIPQKPERPVLPGDIGFIKIVFDSKGRIGETHKTITVTSNAYPEFQQLLLKGQVVAKQ